MAGVIALLCWLTLLWSAAASDCPRVRKELRSLTAAEYDIYVQGMSVMLSVATPAGRRMYGKNYKMYNDLVVQHAVASRDPRGDQGHNGPAFMTFHRAFVLAFERSLLSVVPGLRALPYLDITLDTKGGKYYKTKDTVFSPKYAGSLGSSAGVKNNFQVSEGVFAWRMVPPFNWALYNSTAWIFNGSLITGLLRGPTNGNTNAFITRYPPASVANDSYDMAGGWAPALRQWVNVVNGIGSGMDLAYTQREFARCLDPRFVRDWMGWNYCADFTTFLFSVPYTPAAEKRLASGFSMVLHVAMHWLCGVSPDRNDSDLKDLVTSPNEVMLFALHHANIDRSAMTWQRNALRRNATVGSPSVMWGYPKSAAEFPSSPTGTFLHDVVNSYAPFTDLLDVPAAATPPSGATHYDMLSLALPSKAVYVYDTMK